MIAEQYQHTLYSDTYPHCLAVDIIAKLFLALASQSLIRKHLFVSAISQHSVYHNQKVVDNIKVYPFMRAISRSLSTLDLHTIPEPKHKTIIQPYRHPVNGR